MLSSIFFLLVGSVGLYFGSEWLIDGAKNLAKRVINYTSLNNLSRRLQRMVNLTKHMNFFVTNNEIEALSSFVHGLH